MITDARTVQRSLMPPAILIVALSLIGGCGDDTSTPPAVVPIIEDISTEGANALILEFQGDSTFAVLDVRTPGEYAGGHLADAILIDYTSASFSEELSELDREFTYLIYCQSGGRSGQAKDVMRGLGFLLVYNMLGGFGQWEADGFPVAE